MTGPNSKVVNRTLVPQPHRVFDLNRGLR